MRSTSLVFRILALIMLFSGSVQAQSQAVLVANVGIEHAAILSQEGNTITVNFDITNGEGIQTGVRYAVLLAPVDGQYVADEHIYDESLTLAENSSVHREVTYTAPAVLSGKYDVLVESRNESNFPFSIVQIGTVDLTIATKGILIYPETCYLQVDAEAGAPHYTLHQNVDILPTETLRLTCTALNQTGGTVSATPAFITRYYSPFGSIVNGVSTEGVAVSFAPNEQKEFSLLLPKGATPQLYSAELSFSDIASNTVYLGYIIGGVNASVQKLSLDKTMYEKGDVGRMAIIWSSSAGNFPRTGKSIGSAPAISITATIANKDGISCATPINQALTRDPQNPQSMVSFTVTRTCKSPQVAVTLTDTNGTVLDQKTYSFTTPKQPILNKMMVRIGAIALVLIAGIGFVIIRKKRQAAKRTILI